MKVKPTMQIGELSRRTGVAPHQLRYYESQGLLTPERTANGYRQYPAETVVAVAQIRGLLDAGLSTEEIAYLQPCLTGPAPELEPCRPLLDTLRSRRSDLERRIRALEVSRRALTDYIELTERRAVPD
ncbi:MerR family transcriptional regulator [Nocardioides speluncae]|uniref:MerR family transcriptional regulator n=1 Tax=Nocardioides speluncae TaxID=2670337 RepID=UPI001F0C5210|nr:MerR family transcriptional regulator [Nocardioides speluncae]